MKTTFCDETVLTEFESTENFRREFVRGLSGKPKTLPCKFFYDERGSQLFEQICELEEYYPTRTESKILSDNIDDIASLCGTNCLLVELGSGSSTKTRLLLNHLEAPAAYVPIDISHRHLMEAAGRLSADFFPLEILPVSADYNAAFALPVSAKAPQRMVIFFPGSTIGNFEPRKAKQFLERVASWCQPGDGLLIGVDLQKDKAVLERAYNDAKGITAAFNLNLLERANRELDANFRLERFRHRAIYNEACGRIEMYLVSACQQIVQVAGREIRFEANEHITTEHSYKYRADSFRQLTCSARWFPIKTWTDIQNRFSVHYLSFAPELKTGVRANA
jgi:dimethylhistidine N-methyltransferase